MKIYVITNGRSSLGYCVRSMIEQVGRRERVIVLAGMKWIDAHHECERCNDEYFLRVDDDFILHPLALGFMKKVIKQNPEPNKLGLVCWRLFDAASATSIEGVKVYRTESLKSIGGSRVNEHGRIDRITNKTMAKAGFLIDTSDHRSVVGIHACGSRDDIDTYEKIWAQCGKPIAGRYDAMYRYADDPNYSMERQFEMRVNFLNELNKKLDSDFHRYVMANQ